ncbi:MAG: DUF4827 domain-containing protein [Muribaculaceae bacterium]|nr:DUF4827 domain-containing protein [Muribaculaceae bacterium]
MRTNKIYYFGVLAALTLLASCESTKSYSELLTEEEHAVNWFMANHEIVPYVPADSVFLTGPDAPYYRMDENGYVYMQVINPGDMSSRPEKGQTVYFRYKQRNIKDLYNGIDASWGGNADNLLFTSSSLIFGNTTIESTTNWGEGIQVPLKYLGYNSEVNLVIKSPTGMPAEQTECIPYEYNIKYFKAEY